MREVSGEIFRETVEAVDAVYRTLMSKRDCATHSDLFPRLLMVCRMSMLSAAAIIAERQPLNSAGITRRAVEAAILLLEIQADPEVNKTWQAEQQRSDRWEARLQNQKPPRLDLPKPNMAGDELYAQLRLLFGTISDSDLHLTPEYLYQQDFEVEGGSGETVMTLNYFHRNGQEVERSLLGFATAHMLVLKAFIRYCGGEAWARECLETLVLTLVRNQKKLDQERPA